MDRRSMLLGLAGAVALAPEAIARGGRFVDPREYRAIALMGGEFAIETSRLALERSRHPGVRQFAQLEINEQVAVAASLGTRPGGTGLRPDQVAVLRRLAATPPGERFDQLYVHGQIAGHRELLELNIAFSQSGVDGVLRAVANVAVPSIQTHLTILNGLQRA